MSNLNGGSTSPQGGDLDQINDMLKAYGEQGKNKKKDSGKLSGAEIMQKMFTPRKDKEYFRILPPQHKDFIETGFFHVVKIKTKNGQPAWKKIYCLAANDPMVPKLDADGQQILDKEGKPVLVQKRCPLCEKSKKILSTQTQDKSLFGKKRDDLTEEQKVIYDKNRVIYKEGNSWEAKEFNIVRGIDKMQPKDGVKFWRFKHNFKGQGVKEKLIPVLQGFIDEYERSFFDVKEGCDLSITVGDHTFPGSNRTYRDVISITNRKPSPLHEDELLVKQWVNDATTWREVFPPKKAPFMTEEEYLERIARGTEPYWDETDQNNKKWVYPDPEDAEIQVRANTRDTDLRADNSQSKAPQMASDLNYDNVSTTSIGNVKKEDVGEFVDNAVNITSNTNTSAPKQNVNVSPEEDDTSNKYDDLPF